MRTKMVSVLLVLCAPSALAQWHAYPDLIFTNGQIVTVDEDFSIHEALAIKGGRIVAVGPSEHVLALEVGKVADLGVLDLEDVAEHP